jgi:oligopeptidase A
VPEGVVAHMAEAAREKGLTGYLVTLHAPVYVPILTYGENRALRERLYRANVTRAPENLELCLEILALRREKATLLGFPDFAELVLSDRMAKTGAKAQGFVDDLRAHLLPAFARENEELEAFVRETFGAEPRSRSPRGTSPSTRSASARSATTSTTRLSARTSRSTASWRGSSGS